LLNFLHIRMAWARAFQICIFYHFLKILFLLSFYPYNWTFQKINFNFYSLQNDVSFLMFDKFIYPSFQVHKHK